MKRILYILMLVAFGLSSARAQSEAADSLRIQKRAERRAELMQTHSQLRLSVGSIPIIIFKPMPIIRITLVFPAIGIEYSYRVWNFLEVGASASLYSFNWFEWTGYYGKEKDITARTSGLNLNLTTRYSWFNRRWVSLYSSLGVWWALQTTQDLKANNSRTFCASGAQLEIIPIGVRVGRRLFGFFEPLGLSGRGVFLQGGVGYKF